MSRKLLDGGMVSVKDENGSYLPSHSMPAKPEIKDPLKSDISLTDLMDSHLLLLYRETRALLLESATGGKLNKDSALSMRENLKLIMELRKKEKELLESMSDEEIKALIEAKLKHD